MYTDGRRWNWLATILLTLLALGGCGELHLVDPAWPTNRDGQPDPVSEQGLIHPEFALTSTKVYRSDGTAVDWKNVVDAAGEADAVVIAEQHGHPRGLSASAALWRLVVTAGAIQTNPNSILKREDRWAPDVIRPALALEFFERDDQSRMDDYLAGLSTEEVFLKRTGKALQPGGDPWASGYPPGHRDMVEAAKKAGVPVYTANAPRAYVRLARTNGYSALSNLTPEQQRLVTLPRFAAADARPDNRYWRDFLSFMGSTPEKYAAATAQEREKTDSMFRAQSIWDATMADTVRSALARGHAPVFLVIGQFHADFAAEGGGGTVQEIKAARPQTKVIVVSFQDADPNGGFRAEDKGRADFVVYCGPHPSASK